MSIRKEALVSASPEQVYDALTDSEKFGALTDKPANIGTGEGDTFSIFGDRMEGRHVELVRGRRIVQAWRDARWEPGVYSMVRFTLTPEGSGTRLTIDQDAYPEGESPMFPTWREHLSTGWSMFYLDPMTKHFGGHVLNTDLVSAP